MMLAKKRPLVSIVTPSYNSGEYLEQAIQSVLRQDYPSLEHIIIDGGSSDQTLAILNRYSQPVAWVSEPDQGQAEAINKGFHRAQGEIVGWLNADDTYQPEAIGMAVDYLMAHPEIELVYGSYNFIDSQGQVLHTHVPPEFSLKRLLSGDAIIPQTSMFFRRKLLETVSGVNPELHYVMDWEFTLRLALRYNVKRFAETWANFRLTPDTKSVRQPERFWPEVIGVLQKLALIPSRQIEGIWLEEALFMAHLLASLEFARVGQAPAAQHHLEQTFSRKGIEQKHPAVIASGLYRAATYPWHSAFQPHAQAQQALDIFCQCLAKTPGAQPVLGYLQLNQTLHRLRSFAWQANKQHLNQTFAFLKEHFVLDWPSTRMVLGALLK